MFIEIKDIKIDRTQTKGKDTYCYWKGKVVAIVEYDPIRNMTIMKEISKE